MVTTLQSNATSTGLVLELKNIDAWLEKDLSESPNKKYQHLLLKETTNARTAILADLKSLVSRAHDDARQRLQRLAGYTLDPLGSANSPDPAKGYPELLDIVTLQGYFGEIFAGVVAENYAPFGIRWIVPALPFRFHQVAFDALGIWQQTGTLPGKIPGRTGDDMIAFELDASGNIVSTLFCEAKCTSDHNTTLLADAHRKISSNNLKPVEVLRLIDVLMDNGNNNSSAWVNALRRLYHQAQNSANYERLDLVCYVCGRAPIQTKTWLSLNKPHDEYTGGRKLNAVEVHLPNVCDLIKKVYGKP